MCLLTLASTHTTLIANHLVTHINSTDSRHNTIKTIRLFIIAPLSSVVVVIGHCVCVGCCFFVYLNIWFFRKWRYLQNRRAGLPDKRFPSDSYNAKHLPVFYNTKEPFYFLQRPANRLSPAFRIEPICGPCAVLKFSLLNIFSPGFKIFSSPLILATIQM